VLVKQADQRHGISGLHSAPKICAMHFVHVSHPNRIIAGVGCV
jgi:hypothetical protein